MMTILLDNDSVFFGLGVRFDEFEGLAQAHLNAFPNTAEIERVGRRLIEEDFAEFRVTEFVKEVCSWGNYPGIWGRVLKRNPLPDISVALKSAFRELSLKPPDIRQALAFVNSLNGLGEPSFASKHLRFLMPSICPVLDSVLQVALPYACNANGYAEFSADCSRVARAVERAGILNPNGRPDNAWYAADVEAAVYALKMGLAD